MASGSISNASPPSLSRDANKKKRTNGSAKLKQIKLNARREQWLSRVKEGGTIDSSRRFEYSLLSKNKSSEQNGSSDRANMKRSGGDVEDSGSQDIDLGSVMNGSIQSSFDHEDAGDDFPGISSSSTSNSLSGNVSEEDDDGCLDDWEAIADALNAFDDNLHNMISETPTVHEMSNASGDPEAAKNPRVDLSKTECMSAVSELHLTCHAWKHDDALRPRCLPNLSKQHSSLLNSGWHGNHITIPWSWQSIASQPSQCPICYEDLDVTDSSFHPCSCGFHLCLFCHKKILEADGRCPNCRKLYNYVDGNNIGAATFHLIQSCNMRTGY